MSPAVGPAIDPVVLERIRTDLDVDDLLKTLDPPKCEAGDNPHSVYPPCGRVAVWMRVLHPCGCSMYFCAEHARECRDDMDTAVLLCTTLICIEHQATIATVDWVKV